MPTWYIKADGKKTTAPHAWTNPADDTASHYVCEHCTVEMHPGTYCRYRHGNGDFSVLRPPCPRFGPLTIWSRPSELPAPKEEP